MNVCFGRGDAGEGIAVFVCLSLIMEGIAVDECLFASVEKGEVLSVELKCFKMRIA